ncbi:MAG: 2Fe-2S iron-sulfur cluster binding domain-containing protein [Acidobacteria bacterium]|nr:2Fe-2S iron-sulfur cluster binding domain-containing protein [Acidobacteriota bacterium]
MPTVRYGDLAAPVAGEESVLDALLRAGASVRHACRAGSCGSCMLRMVDGAPAPASQVGLKPSWRAQGYFLPCICHPDADITVTDVGADAQVTARIASLDALSDSVVRVRLACDAPFDYHPGQYVSLVREDGLARSYSLASLGAEPELELHVRCLAKGRMSEWVRHRARVGDPVRVLGPSGDCFYVPGRPEQPLLLAGTGTGLAPLYGVLRDALAHGHSGAIRLFHGALRPEGLYLREELTRLCDTHPHVEYVPTLLEADGPLDRVVLDRCPAPAGSRAFLCGDPGLVQGLRKALFLQGMTLGDIHADAFLPAA